jgi:oxygen-independent coproporphyrinogen-3 oxidase
VPGQTVADAVSDVETCVKLGVDQISTYPLLSFVHTPLGKRIARGRAKSYGERDRIRVQKEVSRVCREGGLERTSMWSFARPGIPSYTTVTHEDYIGFGAGAATKVDGVFLLNTFSLQAYSRSVEHKPALVMQASDALRRFHWLYWQIYRVRIEPRRYHELYGRDLASDFGKLLGLLRILGLVRKQGEVWRITESGTIWLHRLRWFYSLHHVDTIWTQCQRDAWPTEVVLA